MNLTIKELTALAHFSYIASPYTGFNDDLLNDLKRRVNDFTNLDIFKVNEKQSLGRPYFMSLKLQSGNDVISFPNEPLVSISLQKTIVETPTVGEDRIGTVKEYICTEDYEIEIKGVCVGANGAYPAEEVKALNDLFRINDALEVKDNLFFNLFGIQKIVLKSIKFDEMMGQESVQKYTVTAVSDMPFFAELTDRAKFLQG